MRALRDQSRPWAPFSFSATIGIVRTARNPSMRRPINIERGTFPIEVRAALLFIGSLFSICANAQLNSNAQTDVDNSFQCGNAGTVSASCQTAVTVPVGVSTFSGTATAQAAAAYGELHGFASSGGSCDITSTADNCYEPTAAIAGAVASFSDSITLLHAPSVGTLDLVFHVDGGTSGACVNYPGGNFQNCAQLSAVLQSTGTFGGSIYNPETQNQLGNGLPAPTSVSQTVIIPYAFDFSQLPLGSPDSISITEALIVSSLCGVADYVSCTATANFADTAIVTSLSVVDANGILDKQAVLESASGTDYNSLSGGSGPTQGGGLVTAPEIDLSNGNAALVLLGGLLLILRGRGGRRT